MVVFVQCSFVGMNRRGAEGAEGKRGEKGFNLKLRCKFYLI